MKRKIINRLVLCALFLSLTIIFTVFISFPIGSQGGYINLGDSMIVIASTILGPFYGAFVGGVGSAIADLILAPQYAIFTFIIKGLEGLTIGLLVKNLHIKAKVILASICGLSIMVIGYHIVGIFMYESLILPFTDTLFNFIQMVASLFISQFVLFALNKTIKKKLWS